MRNVSNENEFDLHEKVELKLIFITMVSQKTCFDTEQTKKTTQKWPIAKWKDCV